MLHLSAKTALWMAFTVGAILHALMRADTAVRVKKKFPSVGAFFACYRIPLFVRTVLEAVLYSVYVSYPAVFSKGLALIGLSLNLDLPQTALFAFLFGYIADSLLEMALQSSALLRKEIPALDATEENNENEK